MVNCVPLSDIQVIYQIIPLHGTSVRKAGCWEGFMLQTWRLWWPMIYPSLEFRRDARPSAPLLISFVFNTLDVPTVEVGMN